MLAQCLFRWNTEALARKWGQFPIARVAQAVHAPAIDPVQLPAGRTLSAFTAHLKRRFSKKRL